MPDFCSMDDDDLEEFARKLDAAKSGSRYAQADAAEHLDDGTAGNLQEVAEYLEALHAATTDEIDAREGSNDSETKPPDL